MEKATVQLALKVPPRHKLGVISDATLEWVGEVQAIVNAIEGDANLTVEFNAAARGFMDLRSAPRAQKLKLQAIRAFRTLELRVPITSAGAFIPAGDAFDAMSAVGKVLQSAGVNINCSISMRR